jgi:hypothetical protein
MHNSYVDRGIIKWAPFDALVGHHSMIEELKHRLGKQEKPILSDDQYDNLNRELIQASSKHLEIEITYYSNGYLKNTFGHIKKIDWISKTILLSTYEKIHAKDIIELNILNETESHSG